MWIRQSVSTQLSSMVGWVEKLLLGGQQVGWVVQTVQRVEEVHLQERGEKQRRRKNNDLIGYVTQQCRCLTTAICHYHDSFHNNYLKNM